MINISVLYMNPVDQAGGDSYSFFCAMPSAKPFS